ncbi:Alcohol dehydrogenase 1 [Penicillium atrosanguineum]|uniref:Alcohol dehydrogenase 1 n=1 Tax=Penicillium atrosanguineum TaxID=1132637 RepID=A0A9W9U928_9EURO|nr:Alcohol dehydrogenase 1 [Penicillium atrosanguineum]
MATPSTQIAAVVPPPGMSATSIVVISNTHPVPKPDGGDVLIKLEYSGVCHSDLHSIMGDTPMKTDVAVGAGVDEKLWMGQRVGIRVSQSEKCWREYIVSPAIHVTKIPSKLSPDLAAPLLCAGIAMYSSIMKTNSRPGDWIAILGAGGGLGHMGEKKRQLCISLGATEFLDFSKVDIVEAVKASASGLGAHAVICTANGERAYEQSMQMLRPLGTLVCVGIPNVPFRLPATPFDMIVKGLRIVGNSAGTAKEMDELLAMAVAGDVKAHIECYELSDLLEVLGRLERSEIEGRAVLKIPE